ncbi:UNVERIFIED_CONTAM: hypothetical protein NCL1_13534 [Trichonephila clavipes]
MERLQTVKTKKRKRIMGKYLPNQNLQDFTTTERAIKLLCANSQKVTLFSEFDVLKSIITAKRNPWTRRMSLSSLRLRECCFREDVFLAKNSKVNSHLILTFYLRRDVPHEKFADDYTVV